MVLIKLPSKPAVVEFAPHLPCAEPQSEPLIDPVVIQIMKQIYNLVPPDSPFHYSTVADERAMVQCLVPALYGIPFGF